MNRCRYGCIGLAAVSCSKTTPSQGYPTTDRGVTNRDRKDLPIKKIKITINQLLRKETIQSRRQYQGVCPIGHQVQGSRKQRWEWGRGCRHGKLIEGWGLSVNCIADRHHNSTQAVFSCQVDNGILTFRYTLQPINKRQLGKK